MTHLGKSNNASEAAEGIAEKAHRALDRMSDGMESVQERARDAGTAARTRLSAAGKSAAEASSAAAAGLRGRMEAHPIATLGAVFAAGLVIATLFRR